MVFHTFHYHSTRIFISIILWFALAASSAIVWIVKYNSKIGWQIDNNENLIQNNTPNFFASDIFLYGLPLILLIFTILFWKIQRKLATPVSFEFLERKLIFRYGKSEFISNYQSIKTLHYNSNERVIGSMYDFLSINIPNQFKHKLQFKNDLNRDLLDKLKLVCHHIDKKIRMKDFDIQLPNNVLNDIVNNKDKATKKPEPYFFIIPNALYIICFAIMSGVAWSKENYTNAVINLIFMIGLIVISVLLQKKMHYYLALISFGFTIYFTNSIYTQHFYNLLIYISFVIIAQTNELYKSREQLPTLHIKL